MPEQINQPKLDQDLIKEINRGIEDYLYSIVKPATNTIKRYPFYYTALLLILSVCDIWLPVDCTLLLGFLFFTSIPSAIFCLVLSPQVHLCPWHRAQCVVMLLPLLIPISRIYYPNVCVWWVCGLVGIVLLASLINRIKCKEIPATLAELKEILNKNKPSNNQPQTNNNQQKK